jgi:hypothetical protein
MTPKGQAFLEALQALCIKHQVVLYVGGDWDEPHFILEDLVAGEPPLRLREIEDLTEPGHEELGA